MKKAWKVTVGVFAALLILLLVAEAGIRMFVASQITSSYQSQAVGPGAVAAAEPEVSFGSQPVTIGLLGGSFPHMTISTPSTLRVSGDQVSGDPAATVVLENVRIMDGEPVAKTFHVTTELPNDFLRAVLNQQIQDQIGNNRFLKNVITVSDVLTDPASGTFTIMFTSGVAGVELRPTSANGQLSFEAASTQLFGVDLPDGVAEALTEAMAEGMRQEVTGDMQVRNVTVIPGGLRVEMGGNNVNFSQLQHELQGQLQPAYQP